MFRRLRHTTVSRSKIKAYLQAVTGTSPDEAMVDRFVSSFPLLIRLVTEISCEDRGAIAPTPLLTKSFAAPASCVAASIAATK